MVTLRKSSELNSLELEPSGFAIALNLIIIFREYTPIILSPFSRNPRLANIFLHSGKAILIWLLLPFQSMPLINVVN
jgi:hypothetical protein